MFQHLCLYFRASFTHLCLFVYKVLNVPKPLIKEAVWYIHFALLDSVYEMFVFILLTCMVTTSFSVLHCLWAITGLLLSHGSGGLQDWAAHLHSCYAIIKTDTVEMSDTAENKMS